MPIYEYQCEACGHQLEAMQKVSDAPLKQCPNCEKRKLKKMISMTSFRLKGGGWYATDFAKSPHPNPLPQAGEGDKDKVLPQEPTPCTPEKCAKTPECPNREAAG
ncbi:MAG: zinc ribbon domain-containing protein [Gammaproteobacteria bacterium]|nr:zinc ribbon domain-containing protein [Gammaproteobacteria bacterium]